MKRHLMVNELARYGLSQETGDHPILRKVIRRNGEKTIGDRHVRSKSRSNLSDTRHWVPGSVPSVLLTVDLSTTLGSLEYPLTS